MIMNVLAPPVGLEPTTFRLTAERYYQLSYGGILAPAQRFEL